MSAVKTPSKTDSLVTLFGDGVSEIADGSEISDPAALKAITEQLATTIKQGLSQYRGMTTVLKRCADLRTRACSLIRKPNGHPDWSAQSDTYRQTVATAEAALWAEATADEKRRVDGAIRQHKGRGGILEHYVTQYVLSNQPQEVKDVCKWAERSDGLEILTGEVPAPVKTAVAQEYRLAGIAVPTKFGGEGPATAKTADGPKNDRAEFETALGAMENVAPHVAVSALLRAVSALSAKLMDPKTSEVTERENVEKTLLRIGVVANGTAQHLAGKLDSKGRETVESSRWTKENDRK